MIDELAVLKKGSKTCRESSWQKNGRNNDWWWIEPGETKVIADIKGAGAITHIWMTQMNHYRELLIRITWDNAKKPSVLVPLGDFFGLGHGLVNSYQSLLFTASAYKNNVFESGCALNCYTRMPFNRRAKIELINESKERHRQYFYIDYEMYDEPQDEIAYFCAEFRRTNPFGGWGHEITVNVPESQNVNKGREAWNNNYVILDTKGRGHYIGCNLSVTNFQGTWWGEGDDMIWVDGYEWPPRLHGTGSEDYLNQAWGMQPNAFMRNGSTLHVDETHGYQTSYVHHIENPVRFEKSVKVTIEHGHGNHLANEMSSVGYWYADKPAAACRVPSVQKRMPVLRDNKGNWLYDKKNQCPGKKVPVNAEMKKLKAKWAKRNK